MMNDWYNLEGDTPVRVPPEEVNWDDRWQLVTEIGDSSVSTVFVSLDHGFGDGPPVLFETLIFGGPLADEGERYSTKAEAEAGHVKWVKLVEEAKDE